MYHTIQPSGRREEGVALLFAIGMLTLLLLLGLAFVANSALSQKAAYNNSTRSQARTLGQTALNRIAGHAMMNQYLLKTATAANDDTAGTDDILVTDLSPLVSYSKVDYNDNGTVANGAIDDQLQLGSYLPFYQRIKYDNLTTVDDEWKNEETNDTLLRPHWVFLDDGNTSTPRLIGRYAYRILPPRSNHRINLTRFLTEPEAHEQLVPLGVINAIDLPDVFTTTSPAITRSATPPERTIDTFLNIWHKSFTAPEDIKWVLRNFDDGPFPADLEVFESTDVNGNYRRYYHRFNLGPEPTSTGGWDWDKVNGSTENYKATDAVNNLMARALEFRHVATPGDTEFDITDPDALTPLKSGLEFLNIIGDDPGAFPSLKEFRQQIAANLIDYCDSDDYPTSDVSPETWYAQLTGGGTPTYPTYTGNEMTPYINEWALGFNVETEVVNDNLVNIGLKIKLTPHLIGELINIYDMTITDKHRLYINLTDITVDFDAYVKGTVQYMDTSSPPTPRTANFVTTSTGMSFTATGITVSDDIIFPDTAWNNGYATATLELTGVLPDQTVDCGPDLNTIIGGGVFTSATLDRVKIIVTGIQFNVAGIGLFEDDNSLPGDPMGLDFVNWQDPVSFSDTFEIFKQPLIDNGPVDPSYPDYIALSDLTAHPEYCNFYVGGMEVIDPRQNLNVKDVAPSDWNEFTDIGLSDYKNGLNKLSMEFDPTKAKIEEVIVRGYKNSKSDPSVSDPTMRDLETVSDPAWNGSNHLSTAYIRNAPMQSLWELGMIHRAYPWQTINLQNAAKIGDLSQPFEKSAHKSWNDNMLDTGTSYEGGDGAILDQVKLLPQARSWGKIDLNMSLPNQFDLNQIDSILLESLLDSIQIEKFPEAGGSTAPGNDLITNLQSWTADPLESRSEAIFHGFFDDYFGNTKGESEEVIGKAMHLLKTGPGLVTTFDVVVVAQSINDLEGPIRRYDNSGVIQSQTAKYGQFDFKSDGGDGSDNVYFDQIAGEVRLKATFDRNPANGKVKLRNVKFLEGSDYDAFQ